MFSLTERYLFYFFLFAIPFQTRKILWYEGWRFNEWTSVSVYFTDVLLVILLLFWLYRSFFLSTPKLKMKNEKLKITVQNLKLYEYFLLIFIVISAISIKNSSNPAISWFQWIKLVEFTAFYFYLSRYAFAKFGLVNSFFAILIGGLFQAIIAIIQFLKQSSVGLQYLGESLINSDLAGIASFYLPTGEKVIRAYGTLSHPNVLAGFLFLSLFGLYFIYLYSKLHSEHKPFADRVDKFLIFSYSVILFAFFTTFSRVIIFIWFVSFCFRSAIVRMVKNYRIIFGTKEGRGRIKVILIASLAVIVLFSSLYFDEISSRSRLSSDDQAVELRAFYNSEVLKSNFNIFGAGIGNFVGWLMEKEPFLLQYQYQPVHNIYLLVYSETGILGLAMFLLFLVFLIKDFISKTRLKKSYHFSSLVLLGSFLFIGFFDHFFLTLQQGRLVFWTGLGVLTYLYSNGIMQR